MLDITYVVGFDAVGVRDFGLAIATVAIFMFGVDRFSLDYFCKDEVEKTSIVNTN
jgi:hypothetical protein